MTHKPEDCRLADPHLLLRETNPQLGQRAIRPLRDPSLDPLGMLRQSKPLVASRSEDCRLADPHLLLRETNPQLGQRAIRPLRDPSLDPLGMLRQSKPLVASELGRADAAGGAKAPDEPTY